MIMEVYNDHVTGRWLPWFIMINLYPVFAGRWWLLRFIINQSGWSTSFQQTWKLIRQPCVASSSRLKRGESSDFWASPRFCCSACDSSFQTWTQSVFFGHSLVQIHYLSLPDECDDSLYSNYANLGRPCLMPFLRWWWFTPTHHLKITSPLWRLECPNSWTVVDNIVFYVHVFLTALFTG